MAALRERPPREEEPFGALVARLGEDVGRIVRAEIALLQVRVDVVVGAVKAAGGGIVAGAVIGLAGVGALVASLILVLAIWLQPWAAALLVGVALVAISAAVSRLGVRALMHGVSAALAPLEPAGGGSSHGG